MRSEFAYTVIDIIDTDCYTFSLISVYSRYHFFFSKSLSENFGDKFISLIKTRRSWNQENKILRQSLHVNNERGV